MADKPVTREEIYLAYLTGDYTGGLQKPITRTEKYLYELCLKGIGGEISPEEIKNAVNEYLEKNPVKPGATTEQAQQIEQNKTDIASLKEDLSNKITKFYASSQGETHLADSDNGKIQDMMLYGKSEQLTTTGKNLLEIRDGTQTMRGVTITAKDGVVALKGTATESGLAIFNVDSFVLDGTCILSSNTTNTQVVAMNKSYEYVLTQNKSDTLENAEVSRVCFAVTEGKTYDISNILVQIEKGSVATSYEPYTGGQPSPSPNYPQEIKSVVNPTVKVCGKNLWNPILGGYISNNDGLITASPTTQMAATDFIKTSGKDITVIARNFSSAIKDGFAYRIGFYNAEKKWIKNIALLDGNKHSINTFNITGTEYIRVSAPAGIYDTIQIEYGSEATLYEPYAEQSVQLPYTLNAIPVTSGGNVTIDGQQYVSDYIDVERGKVVRCVKREPLSKNGRLSSSSSPFYTYNLPSAKPKTITEVFALCNLAQFNSITTSNSQIGISSDGSNSLRMRLDGYATLEQYTRLSAEIIYELATPIEEDLTSEQIQSLQALKTKHPVTNIFITSDQLDGCTTFNYPISMANGWNYVKKQLSDNRDYIYDMDIQSAEAYVNSEYAVALTELEV